MSPPELRWLSDRFPGRPALDAAVSFATLERVAAGEEPESLRLYQPDPIVAFGRRDTLSTGYPRALLAASDAGFAAIERLAGGRAAVFHEGTLAFAWTLPDPRARESVHERFETLSSILAGAFRDLGVDARVGEVPGEYCPGSHSINARGAVKLMGVGQRVIRGAAHVGGVVVVRGAHRIREVLTPVYAALGLAWRPETAGSLTDEKPGLSAETVASAIRARFAGVRCLVAATLSEKTLALARRNEASFLPPSPLRED